jgi:hypothetical protein
MDAKLFYANRSACMEDSGGFDFIDGANLLDRSMAFLCDAGESISRLYFVVNSFSVII